MAYDKLVDSSALDSNLDDIADAIRAKSGGSSQLAFPSGFISEIGNISTGGGGGSGYTKKSGTFVLAENYTYATSIALAYTGMLVDTGLSHINALAIWSEEWSAETVTTNSFGLTFCINNNIPITTNAQTAYSIYSGNGCLYNGTNNPRYNTFLQCAIFHSASSDVPEGKFGIRCHSASYPILAGHTIRWEAWGEE